MSIRRQIDKILDKTDKRLNILAKQICETIRLKLQENLKLCWYDNYSPKTYKRTWELFNSVDGKIERNNKNDYTIRVYFNPDKIRTVINDKGWNSHLGFDGQRFIEGLISSIEHGMLGSHSNPRRGTAAHMVKLTQEWSNEYAQKLLLQKLGGKL